MKRLTILLVFITFLLGIDYRSIPLLRWAGPPGSRPGTYEEWVAKHPDTEFSHILDKVVYGDGRAGTVAIITEQNIAGSLTSEISQLINNLQSEGYTVLSHQVSYGTPEALRNFLQNLYNTNNIEGALFIGLLPPAWFEIDDDFNMYGYATFPCDLFLMDLNGTWLDTMNTGNGRYDGHTGNIDPEIYIGRLYPYALGSDSLLLKNYFRKNNAYRHDTLLLQKRALVFVDDDWYPYAGGWAGDVALLYPDTMNYWDKETTRAAVYRIKLDTTQAWVSVFAHSWPGGHQFVYDSSGSYDYYYSHEYTNQDPPTNFYNFFACSFSRFTENCGGNRAIFNASSGLGSVGSAKTGSMLDFDYFYYPLGEGATLGMAFKEWFTYITHNGVTFDELCWHYGMTLLADPYLLPVGHNTSVAETEMDVGPQSILTLRSNPVTSHIDLQLSLEQKADLYITLYDCAGRKVKTLSKHMNRGEHCISWQLNDHTGNILPPGVYIMKAEIGKEVITKKIIKI
jgi:hypothetical protein